MMDTQKNCQKCGAPLSPDSSFCAVCGTPATKPAAAPGQTVPSPQNQQPSTTSSLGGPAPAASSGSTVYRASSSSAAPSSAPAAASSPSAMPGYSAPAAPSSPSATPGYSAPAAPSSPSAAPSYPTPVAPGSSPAPSTSGYPAYGTTASSGAPTPAPGGYSVPSAAPSSPATTPGYSAPQPPSASGGYIPSASGSSPASSAPPPSPYGSSPTPPVSGGSAGTAPLSSPYGSTPTPPPTGSSPYGQHPPAPQAGYAPGGYPPPPGGGYPQPAGAYPPGTPAPKQKSKAPFIIIGLLVLAAIAIIVPLVLFMSGNSGQEEYESLRTRICAATTPTKVAMFGDELTAFEEEHPNLVEADLRALVELCQEYVDAEEDESKFTDMQSGLEKLKESDVEQVSSCAATLLKNVQNEYDDYLFYLELEEEEEEGRTNAGSGEEGTTPPLPSANAVDNPNFVSDAPLQFVGPTILGEEDDGTLTFTFDVKNVSEQTVLYAEYIIFIYDAYGAPAYLYSGDCWSIYNDTSEIAAGASLSDTGLGYWSSDFYPDEVAYVLPLLLYVEFEDGSIWGYADETPMAEVYAYMDTYQAGYDQLALEAAGAAAQYAPAGLPPRRRTFMPPLVKSA